MREPITLIGLYFDKSRDESWVVIMSALACRKGIYQYLQSPQCVEGRTGRGSYQPSLERTRGGNRLGGRLELTRQLLGRASRSHQIDHLSPELRRISGSVAGHQTPQKSTSRVSTKPGQLHHTDRRPGGRADGSQLQQSRHTSNGPRRHPKRETGLIPCRYYTECAAVRLRNLV